MLHGIDWSHIAVRFSPPPPHSYPGGCVWNWKGQGGRASAGGIKHTVPLTETQGSCNSEQRSDNCILHVDRTGCHRRQEDIPEPCFFSANSRNAPTPLYFQVHNNHLIKGNHLPLEQRFCDLKKHSVLDSFGYIWTSGQICQRLSFFYENFSQVGVLSFFTWKWRMEYLAVPSTFNVMVNIHDESVDLD